MPSNRYMRYLPMPWRALAESVPSTSTWWAWPGEHAAGHIDVHVARARRADAAVRVMLVHGGGGHSELMWPLGAILAAKGCEVIAPDLPLYGRTRVEHPGHVGYTDWLDVLSDLVTAETDADPRPLILFGASMGGTLTYEVAHRTGRAAAVVATCFLDFSGDPEAIRRASRWGALASMAPLLTRIPVRLAKLRVPVRWFARVSSMSGNAALTGECARDRHGAGSRVPLRLIAEMVTHVPPTPEEYGGPRVLLVHPGADAWTPPALSLRFAHRIAGKVDTQLLTNCGHFPIEEPGLTELSEHLMALQDDVLAERG